MLVLSVMGFSVLAQTNNPPVPGINVPGAQNVGLLLVIIPVAVPFIVALGKFFIPKLPSWSLPILAPALGALIDYITAKTTGGTFSPVTSALLGSAGVGIREILDQIKKATATPSTPPKP